VWPLFLALVAAPVIDLGEREVLPIVVLAPTREAGAVSASELIRMLGAAIEERTAHAPRPVDPETLTGCSGKLSCVLPRLRIDRSATRALVVSKLAAEGTDEISFTLFDLRAAPDHESSGSDAEEEALADRATLHRSSRVHVTRAADAEGAIAELLEKGSFVRSGSIVIEGLPIGSEIALDGRPLGRAAGDRVEIRGLLPGDRTIAIAHDRYDPLLSRRTVASGSEERIAAELVLRPSAGRDIRAASFWTGAILAGAGVAITIAAITGAALSSDRVCLAPPGSSAECPWRWARLGGGGLIADQSGVPVAPLGLALAIGGGALALGSVGLGGEDDVPWLGALLGAGLGVGTYVFTTQIERDPFEATP
jgi:hypothetical protein